MSISCGKMLRIATSSDASAMSSSLYALVLVIEGSKAAILYLDKIARQHGREDLDIRPELYDVWLKCLIETVSELKDRGVGLASISESIDTTTPGGRLFFQTMGALAEFERDLIVERTKAGIEAAGAASWTSEKAQRYAVETCEEADHRRYV